MKYITHRHMIGFTDEMQKDAGMRGIYEGLRGALRGARGFAQSGGGKTVAMAGRELRGKYGRQMMLGAGVGAAGGAAVADPDQPGGRMRGALMGAGVGAGIAGGRVLATVKGRQVAKKGVSNFYQRQRYAATGKGLGKTDADKLKKARDIGLVEKYDPTRFGANPLTPAAAKKAGKEQARILTQEDALKKGYMSAPGTVHGLLTRPGDVIKSGWRRGGTMGKTFAGLGAYETGKGLIEKPKEGGPGRLEKGLRGAGGALGWMVAPTTLAGGQIIGMGGSAVGSKIGKLGDKVVQRVRRSRRVAPQGGH